MRLLQPVLFTVAFLALSQSAARPLLLLASLVVGAASLSAAAYGRGRPWTQLAAVSAAALAVSMTMPLPGNAGVVQVAYAGLLAWSVVLPSPGAPTPRLHAVGIAVAVTAACALVWINVAPHADDAVSTVDPSSAAGVLLRLLAIVGLALILLGLLQLLLRIGPNHEHSHHAPSQGRV